MLSIFTITYSFMHFCDCNLTLCLGILHAFLLSADFFSKSTFSKNSFRNTIRVSNTLDLEQARHFVGPDLDPNSLERLSADETSSQKCKQYKFINVLPPFSVGQQTPGDSNSS